MHPRAAEELVLVIDGVGTLWQDGETYPLSFGDVIGWVAGSGTTHTIMNNTNAPGQGPEKDLVLLVWGERAMAVKDECYYPFNPENAKKYEAQQGWWKGV
jgi:uncharacterized cupin superfamily protein